MNAYYTQSANQIFPIFGVNSIEEAKEFAGMLPVIETSDSVFMNPNTGSVDFYSNWKSEAVDLNDLNDLIEVVFDFNENCWIEK